MLDKFIISSIVNLAAHKGWKINEDQKDSLFSLLKITLISLAEKSMGFCKFIGNPKALRAERNTGSTIHTCISLAGKLGV